LVADNRGEDEGAVLRVEMTGSPSVPEPTDADARLATWQADVGGIEWLDRLVAGGYAALHAARRLPGQFLDPLLVRSDSGARV